MRMGTAERGMEKSAEGDISEEERHKSRIQPRQEWPHLGIKAGRIVQRDEEEQATVN
jgi:hypothetical protein